MDKVVHFEIPVDNLERAKKFYKTVFDWQLEDYPEMQYTICRTSAVDEQQMPKEPGAINGGMFKRSAHMKVTTPVFTMAVASIDTTAKKLEKAGGKVVQAKFPVAEMGFAAYFKDPEGNVLGLWENAKKQ